MLKYYQILGRSDCQGNMLICTLFGLSRVLHLCPPEEATNNILAYLINIFVNRRSTDEEYIAALRCIYLTAKLTNIHKAMLI